jgi:uncharacterized membrane protein YgdD (TMEM256/DUF423 family)
MANPERTLFLASGVAGALGVALGAFGAHGLRDHLATLADGEARRRLWETAAHYHLVHALAIAVAGYLAGKPGASGAAGAAGLCFTFGIALFSGSLYAMTLTGMRALGAITPFGGLAFIAGWVAIAVAAFRLR